MHVYCDTGAFKKELGALERAGVIQVHQVKYENRNSKILRGGVPSNVTSKTPLQYTYDDLKRDAFLREVTGDELKAAAAASRYGEILQIIGRQHEQDARHIDSALATGCSVFLTSDWDDIASKKDELLAHFNLHVFHCTKGWNAFLAHINRN